MSSLLARLVPRIADSLCAVRHAALRAVYWTFRLAHVHKGIVLTFLFWHDQNQKWICWLSSYISISCSSLFLTWRILPKFLCRNTIFYVTILYYCQVPKFYSRSFTWQRRQYSVRPSCLHQGVPWWRRQARRNAFTQGCQGYGGCK